jgi:hypothetical protein
MSSNYIKTSFDFLVSSNPKLGAVNKSADGSSFRISLENNGLGIPKDAKNVQLQVISGELWYNTPNIVEGLNNRLNFTYGATAAAAQPYFVDLPTGLYSMTEIQPVVERELLKKYSGNSDIAAMVAAQRIKIQAEENQGKVQITFVVDVANNNTFGLSCDFTAAQTIGSVLGFTQVITATITNNYFFSNVEPQFNGFNYYLIQSDITDSGIRIGNTFNQILAKILISTQPQTQLLYQPQNPTLINVDSLAGDNRREYTFRLLTDSLVPVNTRSEFWSIQLRINYYKPVNFNSM